MEVKKPKIYLVVFLVLFLIGCGAGGPGDSGSDTGYQELVASNFRNVMLEWQPNTETNLAGYKVFMREDGKNYDYANPEWDTVDTDCALYNLYKDTTYHFVVRAYDTDGNESDNSNEATLNPI